MYGWIAMRAKFFAKQGPERQTNTGQRRLTDVESKPVSVPKDFAKRQKMQKQSYHAHVLFQEIRQKLTEVTIIRRRRPRLPALSARDKPACFDLVDRRGQALWAQPSRPIR